MVTGKGQAVAARTKQKVTEVVVGAAKVVESPHKGLWSC
jgi:hypothetical protein